MSGRSNTFPRRQSMQYRFSRIYITSYFCTAVAGWQNARPLKVSYVNVYEYLTLRFKRHVTNSPLVPDADEPLLYSLPEGAFNYAKQNQLEFYKT